jgi:hypothetical protein
MPACTAAVIKLTPGKRMVFSELLAYRQPDPVQKNSSETDLPAAPLPGLTRQVAADINARFERGGPTNLLADAGVLVRVMDGFEDQNQPWLVCHERCRNPADHFSGSLISRTLPWLYHGGAGGGFIVSPDAQIECAFPCDVGTGGHPWGRCHGYSRPDYDGRTLEHALVVQYDGSYRQDHPSVSGFNEVVVSWLFWDHSLPWAIDAFFFANPADAAQMRRVHTAFLGFYGLTAADVPLLQYTCGQKGAEDMTAGHLCWHELNK